MQTSRQCRRQDETSFFNIRGFRDARVTLEQVALACARGGCVLIDEILNAARQNPDTAGSMRSSCSRNKPALPSALCFKNFS